MGISRRFDLNLLVKDTNLLVSISISPKSISKLEERSN